MPSPLNRTRRLADRILRRIVSVVPTRSVEAWEKRHEKKVKESVERILPHLPEDGVFLDIGCNIGSFTKNLRPHRPRARGFLFEPVKEYADMAAKRFADDDGIEVLPMGLGNETAKKTIYKPAHNYGGNSIVEEIMLDRGPKAVLRDDAVIHEETVQITDAREWIEASGLEHIDVIKSDTEGYDWAVLESLHGWVVASGQRPTIFVEVFTAKWHPFADRQQAALDAFFALGYGYVELESVISGICGDILLVHEGNG